MSVNYPRELGRAFADAEVARNYRYRPPYPAEVFSVLERLLISPRTVLDAGCGSGAITRGLVAFASRVDAVDPSEAMLREARRLTGQEPRIRWILGRAEDAPLAPPYGLITTGASIHWMDPEVVMPRFRDALGILETPAIIATIVVTAMLMTRAARTFSTHRIAVSASPNRNTNWAGVDGKMIVTGGTPAVALVT